MKENFIYHETSDNPLIQVSNTQILNSIIDPTTNLPYNGIILQGEFASLAGDLNNNNRIYDEQNYLEFVSLLKNQIHSSRGLYGCLEHPEGYQTNSKNISHKILDIWYDEQIKKVFGIVLILNTPNGQIVQEIIKSGGEIGISARGGGSEIDNPDGTKKAVLKLLVTFDIVYHPGFSTSIIKFTNLNESVNINRIFESVDMEKSMVDLNESKIFESIISNNSKNSNHINNNLKVLNEHFANPYEKFNNMLKLFESQKSEQEQDIETLENNETDTQDKIENNLKKTAEQELTESESFIRQQMIDANNKLSNAYFDGSAGFVDSDMSSGIMFEDEFEDFIEGDF